MKRPIPRYPTCFICGDKNERGISLQFYYDDEKGEIISEFSPEEWWCGYKGIVHGGIQAAIIDEGMGWTIFPKTGNFYITMEINIRFRKPLIFGSTYIFKGRLVKEKGEIFFAEGEIVDRKGNIYAQGSGIYKRKSPQT